MILKFLNFSTLLQFFIAWKKITQLNFNRNLRVADLLFSYYFFNLLLLLLVLSFFERKKKEIM